jgi:hypothetical protein
VREIISARNNGVLLLASFEGLNAAAEASTSRANGVGSNNSRPSSRGVSNGESRRREPKDLIPKKSIDPGNWWTVKC